MVAPVARVEMIAPTWDARPLFTAPPISLRPMTGVLRRVNRHAVVATLAVLAGLLLWLPPGFGLGAAARLVLGTGTGIGIAAIATIISMAIAPPAGQ
jgi:hypothetical protein